LSPRDCRLNARFDLYSVRHNRISLDDPTAHLRSLYFRKQ
jgi:hypothetical protein